MKKKIALFASGAGSNAKAIIEHFQNNSEVSIELIVCNKSEAGVLKIAENHKISSILVDKELFFSKNSCLPALKVAKIDFIILAGFLWKIPEVLIQGFPDRIINIHPALLPKYGGKGMYGQKVHAAIIANQEKESGITIHYVDEKYDHGQIIFQAKCAVLETDTPDTLAARIHQLEHKHYSEIIEKVISKLG